MLSVSTTHALDHATQLDTASEAVTDRLERRLLLSLSLFSSCPSLSLCPPTVQYAAIAVLRVIGRDKHPVFSVVQVPSGAGLRETTLVYLERYCKESAARHPDLATTVFNAVPIGACRVTVASRLCIDSYARERYDG